MQYHLHATAKIITTSIQISQPALIVSTSLVQTASIAQSHLFRIIHTVLIATMAFIGIILLAINAKIV